MFAKTITTCVFLSPPSKSYSDATDLYYSPTSDAVNTSVSCPKVGRSVFCQTPPSPKSCIRPCSGKPSRRDATFSILLFQLWPPLRLLTMATFDMTGVVTKIKQCAIRTELQRFRVNIVIHEAMMEAIQTE